MRNSGQDAENEFELRYRRLGKRAYVHAFVDAREIAGRTGTFGKARPQPSDYLVVLDGLTEFAEVKSSHDPVSFRFSLLRKTQSAAAAQILAAGGQYVAYVKNMLTEEWFRIPYSVIKNCEKQSIRWADLRNYKWT